MGMIKITQNINSWVGGNVVPLSAGQEIDTSKLSADELDNLIRGGYAEMIKPAVKVVNKPTEPVRRAAKVRKG